MSYAAKLRTLAGVSVSQWGLITTAQSEKLGVSRLDLSRLCQAEHLIRVRQGVYLDAGVSSTDITYLQAEWLMLKPEEFALDRLRNLSGEPVVASATAAWLHGAGDFLPTPFTFYSKDRIQRAANYVRISKQSLADSEVKLVRGLPTTSPERTIKDLFKEQRDFGDIWRVTSDMHQKIRWPKRLLEELADINKIYGFSAEYFRETMCEALQIDTLANGVSALRAQSLEISRQLAQISSQLPKLEQNPAFIEVVENLKRVSSQINSLSIPKVQEQTWPSDMDKVEARNH
jgi:hypothetical protein